MVAYGNIEGGVVIVACSYLDNERMHGDEHVALTTSDTQLLMITFLYSTRVAHNSTIRKLIVLSCKRKMPFFQVIVGNVTVDLQ